MADEGDQHATATARTILLLKDRTEQLIGRIKPAQRSEVRRKGVAAFVCNVISRCFAPFQVTAWAFGSVPLKTYLPGTSVTFVRDALLTWGLSRMFTILLMHGSIILLLNVWNINIICADGDIDLSIFTMEPSIKESWAFKLQATLEEEQRNPRSPFKIGDINVINAEVCDAELCNMHASCIHASYPERSLSIGRS